MSAHDPAALRLIPNVGAEEGPNWASLQDLPAVAATVNLWRGLFASPHSLLGVHHQPDDYWPPALGQRPQHAAMPWLDETGVQCWLADPDAHSLALEEGLEWSGPAPEHVLEAHDKAFAVRACEDLDLAVPELRGLCSIFEPEELDSPTNWVAEVEAHLAQWPAWTRGRFTLKPRLGSSGRGRLAGNAEALDQQLLMSAAEGLIRRGGVILEPWLDRVADFSVQMHIPPAHQNSSLVTVLGALELWGTPSGVYRGHLGEVDSRGRVFTGGPFEETAREAAAAVAARARAVGYWGPCGVDGLAFRRPGTSRDASSPIVRPVVELNARFTLGTVVMGLVRRSLPQLKSRLGLRPGERRALFFALDTPPAWPDWESFATAVSGPTLLLPLAAPSAQARPALLFGTSLTNFRELRDGVRGAERLPSSG